MAKIKLKGKFGKIVSVALAATLVFGVVALVSSIVGKETTSVKSYEFARGDINDQGEYVESNTAIYTKDLIECQGLTVTPDFEAKGSFQVFYYDSNKHFIGSTDVMEATKGVYEKAGTFVLAKYCRIVITPQALKEDGTIDSEFKIKFYEVYSYANDYSITVNKKQEEIDFIYYGDNKFVNNKNSNASLAGGAEGFLISSGKTDISNLVSIVDCTDICIKVKSEYLDSVQLYFHKQNELHTATSLSKFDFDKFEDGEFVYLSMTLSAEYADDVAICLTAVEGVDLTGTEIYAW